MKVTTNAIAYQNLPSTRTTERPNHKKRHTLLFQLVKYRKQRNEKKKGHFLELYGVWRWSFTLKTCEALFYIVQDA